VKSKLDAGKSAQTLQWVGYGAAAAAGAGAVVCLVLSRVAPAERRALVVPLVGPHLAGGAVHLGF
jgi:hypothetical protein